MLLVPQMHTKQMHSLCSHQNSSLLSYSLRSDKVFTLLLLNRIKKKKNLNLLLWISSDKPKSQALIVFLIAFKGYSIQTAKDTMAIHKLGFRGKISIFNFKHLFRSEDLLMFQKHVWQHKYFYRVTAHTSNKSDPVSEKNNLAIYTTIKWTGVPSDCAI